MSEPVVEKEAGTPPGDHPEITEESKPIDTTKPTEEPEKKKREYKEFEGEKHETVREYLRSLQIPLCCAYLTAVESDWLAITDMLSSHSRCERGHEHGQLTSRWIACTSVFSQSSLHVHFPRDARLRVAPTTSSKPISGSHPFSSTAGHGLLSFFLLEKKNEPNACVTATLVGKHGHPYPRSVFHSDQESFDRSPLTIHFSLPAVLVYTR